MKCLCLHMNASEILPTKISSFLLLLDTKCQGFTFFLDISWLYILNHQNQLHLLSSFGVYVWCLIVIIEKGVIKRVLNYVTKYRQEWNKRQNIEKNICIWHTNVCLKGSGMVFFAWATFIVYFNRLWKYQYCIKCQF